MKRKSYKRYLGLVAALFVLVILPTLLVEAGRVRMVAFFSPLWKPTKITLPDARLEAENHLLRLEIGRLRTLVDEKGIAKDPLVVSASVIYRDPTLWMNSMWVNVGEETNALMGSEIISHNSPVLFGGAVVGVVDYVGKKQSRIRLVTDMSFQPSVRAARGLPSNAAFVQHLDAVLMRIKDGVIYSALQKMRDELDGDAETWYLAKGVISGAGSPLWRDRTHILKGYGFNYDFADEMGCGRELLSGKPLIGNGKALPIIQESDLLVTTGMDGVFPRGLKVAEVTHVYPMREGAFSYEIDAVPYVKNLDSLQTVFIIPKVGFEEVVDESY